MAGIPDELQELVHTMLPTVPIDKLDYLRRYGGQHKGVDLQAKPDWENCDGEIETKGKGEPWNSGDTILNSIAVWNRQGTIDS